MSCNEKSHNNAKNNINDLKSLKNSKKSATELIMIDVFLTERVYKQLDL
jgi:hypothetical protein